LGTFDASRYHPVVLASWMSPFAEFWNDCVTIGQAGVARETSPKSDDNKMKDIIYRLYLFLSNDRFICIGLVYGVVRHDRDERALRLLALLSRIRVTMYYKRRGKIQIFERVYNVYLREERTENERSLI